MKIFKGLSHHNRPSSECGEPMSLAPVVAFYRRSISLRLSQISGREEFPIAFITIRINVGVFP